MKKPITEFKTNTGEVVRGDKLQKALNLVAINSYNNAEGIYKEDLYADHITEEYKLKAMERGKQYAELIKQGYVNDLTVVQHINYVLTGECIAILP